jgi:transcriptional regulator with XRE-family HTH domain
MTAADQVQEMRRGLGRELAARRREAGFSQRQLAPLTGYTRSTLSDAELGRHHVQRDFWERCQRVLRVGGELTCRYDQIEAVAAACRAAAIRAAQAEREERAALWPVTPLVVQGANGHDLNGHGLNGHGLNGPDVNGRSLNGPDVNGHGLNGHGLNGHDLNGHNLDGYNGNGHYGAIASQVGVVTVQPCPSCHQPLAVITILAAPPH